jgi:ribose transport system ATP-binding protein
MTVRTKTVAETRNLYKSFQAVTALKDMTIGFDAGSVHVLFGENGAGKSTLISLLSGIHKPDTGEIIFDGRSVSFSSPRAARELGISAVYQEPALIPQLTVAENLTLGREPLKGGFLDRQSQEKLARAALDKIGSKLPLSAYARDLSRAEQQIVEMARALQDSAKLLILDEPTASLTEEETDQLFKIVTRLREEGIAMIYITHRMAEIRRIGDVVSVMRDGCLIKTVGVSDVTDQELVELMTGRKVEALFPQKVLHAIDGGLDLVNVSNDALTNISMHVRRGEIVGVAGLVGSGKSEIGKVCFGMSPVTSGRIEIDGKDAGQASPQRRLERGVMHYPSDRKKEGLIGVQTARENVTLSALDKWLGFSKFIRRKAERNDADAILAKLSLRPFHPDALPSTFSGGNQQKIVLARGFTRPYAVHIFDEPTAGVDVGARAEIYQAMHGLAKEGAAVLVISSDLPEIVNLVHRAYVVSHGQIVGEFSGADLSEKSMLPHFFHEPEMNAK